MKKIDITRYEFKERIGTGGQGSVYKVEEKSTGKLYAAKIIENKDDESQSNQTIDKELEILIFTQHPTIIKS